MFGGLIDRLMGENMRDASDEFRRRLAWFTRAQHEEKQLAEEYPTVFPDYKWGGFTLAELLTLKGVLCMTGYEGRVKDFCNDLLENGMPSQRELLAKQYRERIAELQGKIHTLETKP